MASSSSTACLARTRHRSRLNSTPSTPPPASLCNLRLRSEWRFVNAANTAGGLGGFTQEPDGRLLIHLAGTIAGEDHGQIVTNDAIRVGGTLEIQLAGSFAPALGDAFVLVRHTLSSGVRVDPDRRFDTLLAPELPSGLSWQLDSVDRQIVLRVVEWAP